MATNNMHKQLKFGCAVSSYASGQTERQRNRLTDRHTYPNTSYPFRGGGGRSNEKKEIKTKSGVEYRRKQHSLREESFTVSNLLVWISELSTVEKIH